MKKHRQLRTLVKATWIPFTLAASLLPPAWAQTPPTGGTLLQQTQPRLADPQPGGNVLPSPELRPAMAAVPGLKVTPTGFRITGNTVYPEAELLAQIQEFIGKEADFAALNEAATKVRAYYRARGYFLAQAYLPRQEIRSGSIEITVIEGRLGETKLDLANESRISAALAQGVIDAHLRPGDLITEEGLERPLLILSDLPGTQVSSTISPSATLGAADLGIKVEGRGDLVTGSVEADNYGNRFTGTYRLTGSMSINSPFGLGDLFSASAITSYGDFNFGRVAYILPVGPYGTRVGISYALFDYALGKDFEALQAHGKGDVVSIYALHPFIRTRNANLIGQFAYEKKNLDDFVDSTTSVENRKIDTLRLGAVGDFRDGLAGGGLNSFGFTFTFGELDIGPALVLTNDQGVAGLKTAGSFSKFNYEFRRLQKINDDTNLLLSLTGQWASKNLASAEKFSLGGTAGVRAYPTGEASGDSGLVVTAELRYIVPEFKLLGGDLTIAGFVDYGEIRTDKEPLAASAPTNRRSIAGYGIGLTLGKAGDFLIRSSLAVPTNRDNLPLSDPARSGQPRFWLQGIKWF